MATAPSSKFKAHQAIGAYFCAFSALDRELGETVKVVFRLQQHEAADTIIAALEDFSRKVRLVRGAVQVARHADGSATSAEWRAAADETSKKILALNDTGRVPLAHSFSVFPFDGFDIGDSIPDELLPGFINLRAADR
jgi:hypothetical protein